MGQNGGNKDYNLPRYKSCQLHKIVSDFPDSDHFRPICSQLVSNGRVDQVGVDFYENVMP